MTIGNSLGTVLYDRQHKQFYQHALQKINRKNRQHRRKVDTAVSHYSPCQAPERRENRFRKADDS